ncbi:hypothetical protein AAG570_002059 [Ranatra chinensis]|uniref:Uncharacterized protein n=1 Tax=Ranatra chinensis TaxID=642074 RepID=A0ABD0YAC2_9HEMI
MSKLVAKVCPDEKESGKKEKVKSIKIPPAKTSNQNGLQHRFLKGETFESAKNPPKEVGPPMSEYTEKYKFNEFYSEQPLITDMSPMAYCKINDIARTAQSKADIQYGGKTVLLDPYVSTSHMSYHYKSPADALKSRGLYDTGDDSRLEIRIQILSTHVAITEEMETLQDVAAAAASSAIQSVAKFDSVNAKIAMLMNIIEGIPVFDGHSGDLQEFAFLLIAANAQLVLASPTLGELKSHYAGARRQVPRVALKQFRMRRDSGETPQNLAHRLEAALKSLKERAVEEWGATAAAPTLAGYEGVARELLMAEMPDNVIEDDDEDDRGTPAQNGSGPASASPEEAVLDVRKLQAFVSGHASRKDAAVTDEDYIGTAIVGPRGYINPANVLKRFRDEFYVEGDPIPATGRVTHQIELDTPTGVCQAANVSYALSACACKEVVEIKLESFTDSFQALTAFYNSF